MFRLIKRTYFQKLAMLMVGLMVLGTANAGLAHVRCLAGDHHTGHENHGTMSSTPQADEEDSDAHHCCPENDGTDAGDQQPDYDFQLPDGHDCGCFEQAEKGTDKTIQPIDSQRVEIQLPLNGEIVSSSKPSRISTLLRALSFQSDASLHPPEETFLVNGVLLN